MSDRFYHYTMCFVDSDTSMDVRAHVSREPGQPEVYATLDLGGAGAIKLTATSIAAVDLMINKLRDLRRQAIEALDQNAETGQPTLLDDLEARAAS